MEKLLALLDWIDRIAACKEVRILQEIGKILLFVGFLIVVFNLGYLFGVAETMVAVGDHPRVAPVVAREGDQSFRRTCEGRASKLFLQWVRILPIRDAFRDIEAELTRAEYHQPD